MLSHAEIQLEGEPSIEVMFNPTQYGLVASSSIRETQSIGHPDVAQFGGGEPRVLSMELLFDTYEQRTDVRAHTKRIYGLLEIDPGKHRPPIVTFAWGSLRFTCWVQSVDGRFTLFLDSGVPARATLTVTFKEYVDPATAPEWERTESADHAKTYVVRATDTLAAIAAAEYGDPRTWRPIATANAIDNPRVLRSGQRLLIPPLPERRGSA